ncbi:hypothetical protein [Natronomonas gomsonensis]|uniref:DUF7542 family protein n=1 Tax=Natronomonas gomsonensis TaxID=1046043 RepID=UPI0015B932B2|nr:hypothetical protein [Natronomonas gomsonensis]
MTEKHVTVSCRACDRTETFEKLRTAREFIETHRTETGHEATWELPSLASGVERAGADAGVCGRPECTTTESPLYQDEE